MTNEKINTDRNAPFITKLLNIEYSEFYGQDCASIVLFNMDDAFTAGDFDWINEIFKSDEIEQLPFPVLYHLFCFSNLAKHSLTDRQAALEKVVARLESVTNKLKSYLEE